MEETTTFVLSWYPSNGISLRFFPWTSSKYYTASLFSIRVSYPLKVIKESVCNSTFGENLIDLREERATK